MPPRNEPNLKVQAGCEVVPLMELKRRSPLAQVPIAEACRHFRTLGTGAEIRREEFVLAYKELLAKHTVQTSQQDGLSIWQLAHPNETGAMSYIHLAAMLSIVCQGSEEDRLQALLLSCDGNGQGSISRENVVTFFTHVFQVAVSQEASERLSAKGLWAGAKDMAEQTMCKIFQDHKEDLMSFAELRSRWLAMSDERDLHRDQEVKEILSQRG